MFNRFDDPAKRAMSNARKVAFEMRHDWIGAEHMLLALCRDEHGAAVAVLADLGVEPERVQRAIERVMTPGPENEQSLSQVPFTAEGKKALEGTYHAFALLNHDSIGTQHLLMGLVRAAEGAVAEVLAELGLDADRVEQAVRRRYPPRPGAPTSVETVLNVLSQEMMDAFGRSIRQLRGGERVDVSHFLAALLDEPGYLTRLLDRLGVDADRVRETIVEDLRRKG